MKINMSMLPCDRKMAAPRHQQDPLTGSKTTEEEKSASACGLNLLRHLQHTLSQQLNEAIATEPVPQAVSAEKRVETLKNSGGGLKQAFVAPETR